MTDLVYDYVTMGVDMIVNAVLLSAICVLLYTTSTLSIEISNQQATADSLSYYMEFNQFDGTDVLAADVIGAILRYHKSLDIKVTMSGSKTITCETTTGKVVYQLSGVSQEIAATTAVLSSIITSDKQFTAQVYTSSGTTSGFATGQQILRIEFKQK